MPSTRVKTERRTSLEELADMKGSLYGTPLYLKGEVNDKPIQIMTIKEMLKLQGAAVSYQVFLPAQPVICHLLH
jgi:hypothetical protein